ncbi:MAG: glycosyltransferase, partial [Acidobacteriota bacterium]
MMPWQYMVKDSIIRRILLEEKPDLIEVTDKYTLSLIGVMIRTNNFKRLGRPILVHFSCERMDDNVGSFLTSGLVGKWFSRRVIGNYTLPNFDYHIANSRYTAQEFYESLAAGSNKGRSNSFLNWCWRFFKAPRVKPKERIFVCPRGVDSVLFSPDRKSETVRRKMRELSGVPREAIMLLYAGRISPEKNIGLLADLMMLLSKDAGHDFRLLVAGAGPQSQWLQAQGDQHAPGKIKLLGHLDKEKLADFYANADVFVHPNPREPFGIAPLEAMASGVATVAPNAGGILSYATNENAWLVEPSADAFAAAIREAVDDEPLRKRKIENALTTARENTSEASTDHQFATYDKIYEHFQANRDLFVNVDAAKEFDFVHEVLSDN